MDNAGSSDAGQLPKIRGEHAEKLFYAARPHNERTCRKCRGRKKSSKSRSSDEEYDEEDTNAWLANFLAQKRQRVPGEGGLPPQTMMAHIARELEEEFAHHKS